MEGRLTYSDTGFSSHNAENQATSSIYLNLPRDLALANRKNFAMTSKKGVPLVYHCKFTVLRPATDDTDVILYQAVGTAQKNWVTRNASVKLHYARERMFKNAGVRRSERGRYDSTIRLVYDSATQSWAVPLFTDDSSVFTVSGSEWDHTKIAIDEDDSLVPALFGPVANEAASVSATTFNIQNAYLNSRRKVELDDLTSGESSAEHSIIRSMFNVEDTVDDELSEIADDNQDQPPYDSDAAAGTFTSVAYAALIQMGNISAPMVTYYVDIPFGICQLDTAKQTVDDSNGDMSGNVVITVEVLGHSEMEG